METRKIGLTFLFVVICSFSSAQNINTDTLSQDSVAVQKSEEPQTITEKRKALLMPEYYTKFLGASFFNIAPIDHEFNVAPVRIVGLTFFYDFGDCFIGMQSNTKGVVVQMNIRLFAEIAEEFIQKAIDYGYKYVGNGTNINTGTNEGIYNSTVKRYRKATKNGNVYLEVATSSQYIGEYKIIIFRAK